MFKSYSCSHTAIVTQISRKHQPFFRFHRYTTPEIAMSSKPISTTSLKGLSTPASSSDKPPVQSRLSSPLPPGTWDSHTHVIQPDLKRFPMIPSAEYKPHPHTIADAITYYRSTSGLGIGQPKMVLTQVSVYGKDNSAMLEALSDLGPDNGRALVEMDPTPGVVSRAELDHWHQLGVRGARVNLVSVSRELNREQLKAELEAYAAVVRSMPKWVLELYVPLHYMDMLSEIVPDLGVKVVVDHFGGLMFKNIPSHKMGVPEDPYNLHGFKSLVQMLKDGSMWCKISGFYRVTQDIPEMKDLEPIGKELVSQAPDRVVWASDWPHTRFETMDSVPFVEMCYRWCDGMNGGSGEMREKLFKKNAEVLWDVN